MGRRHGRRAGREGIGGILPGIPPGGKDQGTTCSENCDSRCGSPSWPLTSKHSYPLSIWETRLQQLAVFFLQLDLAFPDRCLFNEIPAGFLQDEPREEDRVSKEQYFSFVYDNYSWLGEEVNDYVETSLQESPSLTPRLRFNISIEPQAKECHDADLRRNLPTPVKRICLSIK